jgi:hypothetical protein
LTNRHFRLREDYSKVRRPGKVTKASQNLRGGELLSR